MVQIIDASVAIKWFIEESGREKALEILERVLNAPSQFAVPELFYFELAHVFHRVVKAPSELQIMLLTSVATLGIHRFSMTPELLFQIRFFQELGLSGYDAAYIGLAKITKGKWLTFDQKAHALIKNLSLSELL